MAVIGLLQLLALPALADPGDHIRAGDVTVAPDVDLGTEYRTNVYRDETTPVPAAHFRVAPGLLVTAGGDDHEFKLSGEWVLRKYYYIGDDQRFAGLPFEDDRVGNLDRYDEFQIAAGADLYKRSTVGLRLAENMELRDITGDCEYCDVPFLSQYRNTLGAGVRVNPGAALEVVPGASWTYDSFRVPGTDGSDRHFNDRSQIGPRVDGKWAFLPRTSMVGSAEWLYNDWQENEVGDAALPNSNQVKALLGIDGRFTAKVLAQVMVGYGVGMFNEETVVGGPEGVGVDATGIDGLLIRSQVRYLITPSQPDRAGSSVTAGYGRDFLPSFFTNYVQVDEVFTDLHGRLGPVEPSLRYELRHENYNGAIDRSDWVNKLLADLRVPAADWAAFTAGGWWQQRASSDLAVEYDDFNVHALATFVY